MLKAKGPKEKFLKTKFRIKQRTLIIVSAPHTADTK